MGEALSKQGGTDGHGGGLVQTGVNWCVPGKGKAKGKAKQKEGAWGRAKPWAVSGMATGHGDSEVRGQAALLGAVAWAQVEQRQLIPRPRVGLHLPAFVNTSEQKGIFVFPCHIQGCS